MGSNQIVAPRTRRLKCHAEDEIPPLALFTEHRRSHSGGNQTTGSRNVTILGDNVPDGPALAELVFHQDGIPIGDIRKSLAAACTTAGVPGLRFHDPVRHPQHDGQAFRPRWP